MSDPVAPPTDDLLAEGPVADLKYIAARDLERGDVWIDMGVERPIEYEPRKFDTGMVQYRTGSTVHSVPGRQSMWVLRPSST